MKITKSQLRELIEEEIDKVFLESEEAAERAKKRTREVLPWKTFCTNTKDANYPRNEEGAPLHYDDMPAEFKKCRPTARATYLILKKKRGELG
jgi:hypothetical protein|tara:strand:- start:6220 stop:6498 length:279 start_codon:yes stop_codon:yes gene_type:complete